MGSPHNVKLLYEACERYVVLYKDLHDVAVSHYFYVRQTSWHPEYLIYSRVELQDALLIFADRTLVDFANWVRSWEMNRNPDMNLVLRYEDVLADTFGCFTKVAELFELESSPETV